MNFALVFFPFFEAPESCFEVVIEFVQYRTKRIAYRENIGHFSLVIVQYLCIWKHFASVNRVMMSIPVLLLLRYVCRILSLK